jgi:hypothetical protein
MYVTIHLVHQTVVLDVTLVDKEKTVGFVDSTSFRRVQEEVLLRVHHHHQRVTALLQKAKTASNLLIPVRKLYGLAFSARHRFLPVVDFS